MGLSAGRIINFPRQMIPGITNRIFSIKSQDDFQKITLEIFKYQAENNKIYREYLDLLDVDPATVNFPVEIPFLPAGFFRDHKIITGDLPEVMVFESSGTSGDSAGKHYVTDRKSTRLNSSHGSL